MQRLVSVLKGWLMILLLAAASAAAGAEDATSDFVRIRRDSAGRALALETAIVRYTSPRTAQTDYTVDLIGAVHVADQAYYDRLNALFSNYEAVLYELVMSPDAGVPPPEQRAGNPVSAVQLAMKHALQLEFQLDGIDYTKPNLVHADLTTAEFSQSMEDRGESFSQWFLRVLGHSLATPWESSTRLGDTAVLAALISSDRVVHLKRIMALELERATEVAFAIEGENGSTLLGERNKRALEVLASQLRAGKHRLAIFYGAAHLSDLEQRMIQEFHMTRSTTEWLPAWQLSLHPSSAGKPVPD